MGFSDIFKRFKQYFVIGGGIAIIGLGLTFYLLSEEEEV